MALQVWLPLNGNSRNQGLDHTTEYEAPDSCFVGQVRRDKAYDLKNSYYFTFNSLKKVRVFSVAFWIYTKPDTSYATNWVKALQLKDADENGVASGGLRFEACWGDALRGCSWHNNPNNVLTNGSRIFEPNQQSWCHCCMTFDGEYARTYANGILLGQDTQKSGYLTGDIVLGSANFRGFMNDLRIYDHALSAKEVKEISKGLILHYPFNQSEYGENLANYTNDPSYTSGWAWSMSGGSRVKTVVQDEELDKRVTKIECTAAGSSWSVLEYLNISREKFKPSTKYTVSFMIKPPDDKALNISIRKPNSADIIANTGSTITSLKAGKWNKINYILTTVNTLPTLSDQCLYILGSGFGPATYYFTDLKIVEGEFDNIPWAPASTDSGAILDTIEYDTSGFNNNGTSADSTVAPILIGESPRYNSSYRFSKTSNMGWLNPKLTSGCSVSFWCKVNAKGTIGLLFMAGQDGSHYILASSAGTGDFYHAGSGSGITIYGDGKVVLKPIDDNEWHHYVATNVNFAEWTEININKYAGVSSNWNGDINFSDFRIYTTILTAEDVLELYNTSAAISDKSDMFAYEFIEE